MIRTVWLAIACLIGLAALTVIRVGTTSLEATGASDQITGSSLVSDASSSDASPLGTLAKGDRLDVADEEEVKPVRPIAITTKVAAAAASAASEASSSEKSWRSSYAKRQASAGKHRKGKYSRTARRHRSYHASRSHAKSKYAMMRKHKKSRSRG
jgi:hypothetical protein